MTSLSTLVTAPWPELLEEVAQVERFALRDRLLRQSLERQLDDNPLPS